MPRFAISMNASVLLSSMVLLLPRRAATAACTTGFSCSSSAVKASSVFAKAGASFPVVALIFMGTATSRYSSREANFALDISTVFISSSFSAPRALVKRSKLSFCSARTSARCCSSKGRFNSSTDSVNILIVKSINRSSAFEKAGDIRSNSERHNSVSFLQYSP